jgi:hypothetical protein
MRESQTDQVVPETKVVHHHEERNEEHRPRRQVGIHEYPRKAAATQKAHAAERVRCERADGNGYQGHRDAEQRAIEELAGERRAAAQHARVVIERQSPWNQRQAGAVQVHVLAQ